MLFFVNVLLSGAAAVLILLIAVNASRPSQRPFGAGWAEGKWKKSTRLTDDRVMHEPSPDLQALSPMVVAAGMQ